MARLTTQVQAGATGAKPPPRRDEVESEQESGLSQPAPREELVENVRLISKAEAEMLETTVPLGSSLCQDTASDYPNIDWHDYCSELEELLPSLSKKDKKKAKKAKRVFRKEDSDVDNSQLGLSPKERKSSPGESVSSIAESALDPFPKLEEEGWDPQYSWTPPSFSLLPVDLESFERSRADQEGFDADVTKLSLQRVEDSSMTFEEHDDKHYPPAGSAPQSTYTTPEQSVKTEDVRFQDLYPTNLQPKKQCKHELPAATAIKSKASTKVPPTENLEYVPALSRAVNYTTKSPLANYPSTVETDVPSHDDVISETRAATLKMMNDLNDAKNSFIKGIGASVKNAANAPSHRSGVEGEWEGIHDSNTGRGPLRRISTTEVHPEAPEQERSSTSDASQADRRLVFNSPWSHLANAEPEGLDTNNLTGLESELEVDEKRAAQKSVIIGHHESGEQDSDINRRLLSPRNRLLGSAGAARGRTEFVSDGLGDDDTKQPRAAHQITAAMLAKYHLPAIVMGRGAMPVREIVAHLTQSLPGFSELAPAKARRLVVEALEHRPGGGMHGEVKFEKVDWGRWSAGGLSQVENGDPSLSGQGENNEAPGTSRASSTDHELADARKLLSRLTRRYDISDDFWKSLPVIEEDEFHENEQARPPVADQLPDPPPISSPLHPERLQMVFPSPPLVHEDIVVDESCISNQDMDITVGNPNARSALDCRRSDGTQRQRALPSGESPHSIEQSTDPRSDGEESTHGGSRPDDASDEEALPKHDATEKTDERLPECWMCCQCHIRHRLDNGQYCADCDHHLCGDCDLIKRDRPLIIRWESPHKADNAIIRQQEGNGITGSHSPGLSLHLQAWFDAHRDHPYPDAREKAALAEAAGITVNKVNNWSINAKRRFSAQRRKDAEDAVRPEVVELPEPASASASGSRRSSFGVETSEVRQYQTTPENDELWLDLSTVKSIFEEQLKAYLSEHGAADEPSLDMSTIQSTLECWIMVLCEEQSVALVRQFCQQPSIVNLLGQVANGCQVKISSTRRPISVEDWEDAHEASTGLDSPVIGDHSAVAKRDGSTADTGSNDHVEDLPSSAWETPKTREEQSPTDLRHGIPDFDAVDGQIRGILDWLKPRTGHFDGEDELAEMLHTLQGALVQLGGRNLFTFPLDQVTARISYALAGLRKELFTLDRRLPKQVFLVSKPAGLPQSLEDLGIDLHRLLKALDATIGVVEAFDGHFGISPFPLWHWSLWNSSNENADRPGANILHPRMYTDDESDGASVISQVESVFSIASLHSAATGLSVASGFSAAQIETATKELLHIFLDDQVLASLYTVAVERVDIGPVRLQRNIGRLLKAFARDLRNEAEQELEKLAARLVSAKRYYVAQAIIDRYEIRAPSELTSHPQSPLRSQQREDSSDEEEEEVDEGRMEEPVDEDLIEDLLAFRQFLAAGEAFERFRRQLEAFVLPKLTEVKNETTVGEPSTNMESAPNPGSRLPEQAKQKVQPTVLSKIQKATAHLVSAAGLLEPPLDCGWVRLRWQCRCGQQFFGDVKEFRANGVKELIEKMSRSTGAKVTVVPYDSTSTNQNWALKAPSWVRKLTSTSKFGQAKGSSSTEYLPQHNVPAQCPQSTLSTPTSNDTVPSKPKIHLLSCTHRTQRRKCLLQDPIDSVFTDRALFCFMQQQLQRNRSRIRSLLSMRSIQGMFFVKFRLRMGNMVEVRDHNPCCTSTNPNTCECIPPVPKVEPSPTAEYRCTPAGPLATWPPVLSQDLMHMLSSPECINEQETWVLDQLPKRTVGELQASAGQPAEGWGVYYQEGVDFDMVIAVVFVVFLLASLLFAVLWTKFEMDVQGAFGVSSYMITAAGIFLAMVASRAKNFGS